jgi:hypothetical protein
VLYVYGTTTNDYWSSTGFTFSRDDLNRLETGSILAESFDSKGRDLGRAMLTPAAFAIAACRSSGTSPSS